MFYIFYGLSYLLMFRRVTTKGDKEKYNLIEETCLMGLILFSPFGYILSGISLLVICYIIKEKDLPPKISLNAVSFVLWGTGGVYL